MKTPYIVGAGGSGQHATPEQLVDALNSIFGKAAHRRPRDTRQRRRSRRRVPAGRFRFIPSKAPHLQKIGVPISVRFSDFTGIPTISDTDGQASPRGMSIKFHLPDGSETDIVAHSFNGFPTATPTNSGNSWSRLPPADRARRNQPRSTNSWLTIRLPESFWSPKFQILSVTPPFPTLA